MSLVIVIVMAIGGVVSISIARGKRRRPPPRSGDTLIGW